MADDPKLDDRSALALNEIEITPKMIEAGEDALLAKLGGAVEVHWCPRDLAIAVYQAMAFLDNRERSRPLIQREAGIPALRCQKAQKELALPRN